MDIDWDKLNMIERDEYRKMLDIVSNSQVTVEDFKKYVTKMRESVETSLIEEPTYIYSLPLPFLKRENPRKRELEARLKNYLIFEKYLNKPELARQALEEYQSRLTKRGEN